MLFKLPLNNCNCAGIIHIKSVNRARYSGYSHYASCYCMSRNFCLYKILWYASYTQKLIYKTNLANLTALFVITTRSFDIIILMHMFALNYAWRDNAIIHRPHDGLFKHLQPVSTFGSAKQDSSMASAAWSMVCLVKIFPRIYAVFMSYLIQHLQSLL